MTTKETFAEELAVEDALYIHYRLEDRTAIITIDHPPANAFNSQVLKELETAFDTATDDPEVKVIVITGAGQFFVAGADINEIKGVKDDREGAASMIKRGQANFSFHSRTTSGRAGLGGPLSAPMLYRSSTMSYG